MRWSRDNRRVAVTTRKQDQAVIEIIDTDAGRAMAQLPAAGAWDLKWDPSGDAILYATRQEVLRHDLQGGTVTTVFSSRNPFVITATFDVSTADGSLLLPVGNAVVVVRPDGQQRPHLVRGPVASVAWSSDGHRFLVSTLADPKRATVVVVDAESGVAAPLQVDAVPIVDLSLAPGDRELFFAAGNPFPEYWAVSGWLR